MEPEEESEGEDPPMSPVIEDEPVKEDVPEMNEPEIPKNEKTEASQEGDSQNKENVAQAVEVGPVEHHKPENGIVEKAAEKEKPSKPSSSHSSRSGDKHKKSSSRKSSKSDKHGSSSSHKSSSKDKSREKEHKSSSSSHKSSEKDNKKESGDNYKSSRHKSSSSTRHHSSSSSKTSRSSHSKSAKSRHKDKEKDRVVKSEKSKEKKTEEVAKSPEIDISMMSDVEVSSDEDAVMEQCKAIFEEYKPELNGSDKSTHVETTASNSTDSVPETDSLAKKRVAYDGAVTPLIKVPIRNKSLNSMQQIYQRQETIRKMIEEKQANSNVTNQLLPPIKARPSITPVSNMLAFKCAKEKIEAMRQLKIPVASTSDKPSTSSTIAQTASKFYGRQAHASKVDTDVRPAPPVLEPTSTKISYNLRMQYYNMMVKHCLVIYPSCEDAWARAQTEELAVQKKCNTPNIYKSSALLAVNKLRKEAISAGNVNTEK